MSTEIVCLKMMSQLIKRYFLMEVRVVEDEKKTVKPF
jgi:hypothetical protein